jgi:heme oxygenase (biliverdin-IX-beta and delta-forming)
MLRPVLRALKEGTADLHEEAERYVRILDRDAGIADYVRYLRAMYGFHAPVETMLARDPDLAHTTFGAAARCRKATWMRADLHALAITGAPDVCTDLPRAGNLARALGIAYVLEGSTLGGRFILAKLPPPLAALRGTATRYLDGYGPETGALWRAFGDLVGCSIATPRDEVAAVHAARETFARLTAWLARFEERRAQLRFAEAS